MAKDRTQNINIVYRVDTSQIQNANQVLGRASAATDNLRKQTQQFGQQAPQAYKFTSKAIEGMEIEVARLRQQVKLQTTQNTADVKKLSDQYKSAKQQLDAYKKSLLEVDKATKSNASSTQSMAKSLSEVVAAARLFITAGIAKEVVEIALNMAKLSGTVEGVSLAFQRIPGATLLLRDLQKATQGTVTDLELMQNTLQAFNFGIDVQQLPKLLEFARVRAQQTGLSVDYLVNSIVSGIGRKSILILDNLGISAERLKQEFGGASIRSQELGEVTRVVAKIATEELDKMGGSIMTSATLVDQLKVSWHELGVEVSKSGTSTGFVGVLKDAVEALRLLAKGQFDPKNLPIVVALEEINRVAELQIDLFRKRADVLAENDRLAFTENTLRGLEATRDEYSVMLNNNRERLKTLELERQEIIEKDRSVIGLRKFGKTAREALQARESEIEKITRTNDALINNSSVLTQVIKLTIDYRNVLLNTNQAEEEQLGIIEAKREQIDALEDSLTKATSKEQIIRIRLDIEQAEAELRELLEGDFIKNERGTFFRIFPENAGKPLEQLEKKMVNLKKETKSATERLVDMNKVLQDIDKSIDNLKVLKAEEPNILQNDFWDDLTQQIEANKVEIAQAGTDIIADIAIAAEMAEVQSLQRRLEANRNYYDEQIELAGDNERRRKELSIKAEREAAEIRRQIAEKEYRAKRSSILIDTAAGIAKNLAQYPYPFWIVPNLITAAKGAAQLAIADKNKPRFAKGVIGLKGKGTGTSDSIEAKLSKGESVMTASETESSKGLLKAVRARKLNDKVMQQILQGKTGGSNVQSFDDRKIISKLDEVKNSFPDITEQAGITFKVVKKGSNLKQRTRLRTMSQ